MNRVYVPTSGPKAWRQFLAKPELQWAMGYSARTMASSWEAADGLPSEIAAVLQPLMGEAELLLALPEHKTALPGGRRESQSDVFALLRTKLGLVALTVEGKVEEPFGPTVSEWLEGASPGKIQRLQAITELLGLTRGHSPHPNPQRWRSATGPAKRATSSTTCSRQRPTPSACITTKRRRRLAQTTTSTSCARAAWCAILAAEISRRTGAYGFSRPSVSTGWMR